MEVVRLTKNDYDEWLSVLNTVFTKQNKKEMDFEKELPKMCVRDDYHMNMHLAIKENGKICALLGVYPLKVKVGDAELLFTTVGNVATLPEYEGKGYMRILMDAAMEELERIGADASRLGGARQRYNRYGYEVSGISYNFHVNAFTTKYCFNGDEIFDFKEISYEDVKEFAYIQALRKKMPMYVERAYDETHRGDYDVLRAYESRIFIALNKQGEMVGYLSVSGNLEGISDFGAENFETLKTMMYSWQKKVDARIYFSLFASDYEAVQYYSRVSSWMSVSSPCHFKIINFDKVADALIKLKKQSGACMPEGESVIEIKDWGRLLICHKNGEAYCQKTDKEATIIMDRLEATRFLFGPFEPGTVTGDDAFLATVLPLPLSWCTLDRV
ncbi:MAG: GNAT family N-acetyltransferase [Ruminococcaceae bacterium]|nr:GNAT family N-acetyltransferase [Oscillospiraceae bacterium]